VNIKSRASRFAVAVAAGALSLVAVACSDDKETVTTEAPTTTAAVPTTAAAQTIVDIAVGNPDFSLLVEAVTAAGLVETLSGTGPFTVFAPTNAAFEAALTALGLTKDELFGNTELLTKVLTYHVVAGKVLAADVVQLNGQEVATVEGSKVKITVEGDKVKVDAANVVATDIEASNGVIHVIDAVLVPATAVPPTTAAPSTTAALQTLVEIAAGNPDFSLLVEAVNAAGLLTALATPGPITVFAPTNAAFEAALKALKITKDALFADKALLTSILTYHVVGGQVLAADAIKLDGQEVASFGGPKFKVTVVDGKVKINEATVIQADILASNGVIHVIDQVLVPPAA